MRGAVTLLATISAVAALATSAHPAVRTTPDACGSVLLAGTAWLDGKGVDVMSNGRYQGTGKRCDQSLSHVGAVSAGEKWQCVELVNRLYLTRGWISSAWAGNGGTLFRTAPAGLSREANGSITSVSPGDVVSIRIRHNGKLRPYGHVEIVNAAATVTSGTVPLVSQNGGSTRYVSVAANAYLSNGRLTLPGGSGWSYSVVGVVHAPVAR